MGDHLPLEGFRERDWTVAIGYDGRPCLQRTLSTGAFETLLDAMREGSVSMTGDGSEYRSAPVPATRDAIECEMQIHEAMLEGHHRNRTLTAHQAAALETRLALLRAALADLEPHMEEKQDDRAPSNRP